MEFEANMDMNHVNQCKSSDWTNQLAWQLLDELRILAQPSDLRAMLDLGAELSKVQMK